MIGLPEGKSLILFDGYCHLCSGLVQNIIRRDRKFHFLFTPLESKPGEKWRAFFQIPESVDSIVLIEDHKAFIYADAVLKIAERLGGIYRLCRIAYLFQKAWRDKVYRWIARNRIGWFGRRKTCFLPDELMKDRFL